MNCLKNRLIYTIVDRDYPEKEYGSFGYLFDAGSEPEIISSCGKDTSKMKTAIINKLNGSNYQDAIKNTGNSQHYNAPETVKRGETTTIEVVTSKDTTKVQIKLSAFSTKTYTASGTETVDNGDGTMTWKIERAFTHSGETEIILAAKDTRGWSDYETYAVITVTKQTQNHNKPQQKAAPRGQP